MFPLSLICFVLVVSVIAVARQNVKLRRALHRAATTPRITVHAFPAPGSEVYDKQPQDDVLSALHNLGFPASTARRMAAKAGSGDFDTRLRAALRWTDA